MTCHCCDEGNPQESAYGDKDRDFVKRAMGHNHMVLSPVLCHPVCAENKTFLPSTYGYATTIRREPQKGEE